MSARTIIEGLRPGDLNAEGTLRMVSGPYATQDAALEHFNSPDQMLFNGCPGWWVVVQAQPRVTEGRIEDLKKFKVKLSDEERAEVMRRKAVWHMGKDGAASPAVWKAKRNGKTWFVTATHRCGQIKKTLAGAIQAFHDVVKETA